MSRDWSYRANTKVVTVIPRDYYNRHVFSRVVVIHGGPNGHAVRRGEASWRTAVGFRIGRFQIQFRRFFR